MIGSVIPAIDEEEWHRDKGKWLTVKWTQCHVSVPSVIYLGPSLDESGIHPKEGRVKVLKEAPAPVKKEQLRSFMGLTEYYARFIASYAEKTINMRPLLKKGTHFDCSGSCQAEFERLKEEVDQAPSLA
ncbi:uncharacterized protein [Ambystoma mexicanum]|uniref:uncharacterized protein n=1 Tax=Ambystoma mexicanum TaxID=8296 RepID=UPI0037E822F8